MPCRARLVSLGLLVLPVLYVHHAQPGARPAGLSGARLWTEAVNRSGIDVESPCNELHGSGKFWQGLE